MIKMNTSRSDGDIKESTLPINAVKSFDRFNNNTTM